MTRPIVIIGCGGFGREVHDVINAINEVSRQWRVIGYTDDAPVEDNLRLIEERGTDYLGAVSWLDSAPLDIDYVLGIGSGKVRRHLDERLKQTGRHAAVLVHPQASMGYGVRIGDGSVICAGVRLTNNIVLGRHVHLNLNSTVGHDSRLGDYVTVNPLVSISGGVEAGAESVFGTNSTVLQYLSVGEGSVVGAGSCVVKPVSRGAVVKGVPAR